MAFQFPASPTVDQTFTPVAGVTYRWSGTAWHLLAGPGAFITQADADTRYVNIDEAQNTTNRIINGKMAIDQRNAGAAVSVAAATHTLDRWPATGNSPGVFTARRLADSPRIGESAILLTSTTADAALSGLIYEVGQKIEGRNIADFNFGAAGAQPFTIAFEVSAAPSGVAGNYALAFRNGTGTRSFVTTFPVAASGFTTVVKTIPGDTAGTWDSGSGVGMLITFGLGIGAGFHAPAANAWVAGNFLSVPGCVNWMAATGNQLQIANVRLYKGAVDFGPDRRLYAEELALCQRYYYKTYAVGTVPGTSTTQGGVANIVFSGTAGATQFNIPYPVRMRAVPTVTPYNPVTGATGTFRLYNATTAIAMGITLSGLSGETGVVLNNDVAAAVNDLLYGHITASAEL